MVRRQKPLWALGLTHGTRMGNPYGTPKSLAWKGTPLVTRYILSIVLSIESNLVYFLLLSWDMFKEGFCGPDHNNHEIGLAPVMMASSCNGFVKSSKFQDSTSSQASQT